MKAVTHRTGACRIQHEVPAGLCRFEPQPPGCQHAHEMSARKNQDIPLNLAHTGHHPMSPCVDLVWRLSSRATVAKQLPIRPFLANLGPDAAFILTVVPFD